MAFEWQCPKCGKEIDSTAGQCANWECNIDDVYVPHAKTSKTQGWQCPICKVVYAPRVQKCECALAEPETVTNADTNEWTVIDRLRKERDSKE